MKKLAKLFALSFMPLIICSCGKNNKSEQINSLENSIEVSKEFSSEADSSSFSNAASSSKEFTYKHGRIYEFTSWNQDVDKMLTEVLGDKASFVPTFIAPRFEVVVDTETVNSQNTLVFEIECFGVNSSSAPRLYGEKLEQKGFTLSSESYTAYMFNNYTSDVFVTYELTTKTEATFVVRAYILTTREAEWNELGVRLYSEIDIPKYQANAYNTSYNTTYDRLEIYALFVEYNALDKYLTQLQLSQFRVTARDSSGAVQLVDSTGFITMTVYQTYGDYECNALYIIITNSWPSYGIYLFTGITNFPKLVSSTASYDVYSYIDRVGANNPDDYVLCIYYVDASTTDLGNYINLLKTYGFTASELESSSGDYGQYLTSTCIYKKDDNAEIKVVVTYSVKRQEICIAIYPVL